LSGWCLRVFYDSTESKLENDMTRKKIEDSKNALTSTQNKPRKYQAGRRRFTVYISWNYPAEAGANVADLDNRFITALEARRQAWPKLEVLSSGDQGIAAQMDHGIVDAFIPFRKAIGEATGHEVPQLQRVDKTGNLQLLDERVLADTDTLMIISLDHQAINQKAIQRRKQSVSGKFYDLLLFLVTTLAAALSVAIIGVASK